MFGGVALILISLLIFAFIVLAFFKRKIKNDEVAGGVFLAFVIASFLLYGGAHEIDKSLVPSTSTIEQVK